MLLGAPSGAQVTTAGFLNQPRPEAPGALLSHPLANDSEALGRTVVINYLNGWIIVGGEGAGSRAGSDLLSRVYDISDPANPIRRHPSDFGLSYPNNRWYANDLGWGSHGTAQSGNLFLPNVLRVSSFGGPVELGGTAGIPQLNNLPLGIDRGSQAGPWDATFLTYDDPDTLYRIRKVSVNAQGGAQFQTLATFDHVGAFGGGEWHPIFFGDLLIYARSGTTAHDGVVVYRLEYHNFDDPAARSVTPHYVGSLRGGFKGYWPTLFSDSSGLYVIGATTDVIMAADISRAADPAGDGAVTLSANLTVPGLVNSPYPVYQDNFGFIDNRKVDMTRLIAGDSSPIALTLDKLGHAVDTSQISLALGNLWLTGGYPRVGMSQGMAVWVHQQAPDTTSPRVAYHIPQAGRSNYPRHAPLSFIIHEHPRNGGPRNGVDFSVRPVLPGGGLGPFVAGFLIHDFSGVLTFTPDAGLAANTTYQVDFHSDAANAIGFADAAGNYIEPHSYRFSTGGTVNATPPPAFASLSASDFQPAPGGVVTVTATATGNGPFEYRFNFDGEWSAWGPADTASFSYAQPGRPRPLVQVRDSAGNIATGSLRLLVIQPPVGAGPTASGTLAIGDDPVGRRVWAVNPDANTVTVLDAASGAKLAEHPVGQNPRSIARDAAGRYWVACHSSDEIRILNPDGIAHTILPLSYGSAPFAVAPSPDGSRMFVTLHGSGRLLRYDTTNLLAPPVGRDTFPTPRAIAVSADGQRVFVTRFISPELEAEVGEYAGASPTLASVRTITLSYSNNLDLGDRGAGVPNYLAAIAISPDGSRAAVASKQDNVQRGQTFGVNDLTHEATSRAVVSFLDLNANVEIRHSRRELDNADSPSALAFTPLGDTLLVALQGNNLVAGLDALSLAPLPNLAVIGATETSPAVVTLEAGTGLAPQGLLIDPVTQRLFSQDFMGRSVTVRDAQALLSENRTLMPLIATTPTVANETLGADVLAGKRLFYNAADPRMSAEGYLSCATCHVDGGHDGRVWDFLGRGEGLRRTTDLRGRAGVAHGNVHWSANFDEIQDFEHDIRGAFGGTGFLPLSPQQFASLHPSPATGKVGLSPELDALAAYLRSLDNASVPRSPERNPDGTMTAAALRGRDVFSAQSCITCHSGAALTDSSLSPVANALLHDIGTTSALSGTRMRGPLEGVDTPTLHGLRHSSRFLHHGQSGSLEDVFSYAGGDLRLAETGQPLTTANPGAVAIRRDIPEEGGGGSLRGAMGGSYADIINEIGATTPPGVRFAGIDGGTTGGLARIGIRYVRRFGDGTAVLRINGVEQTLSLRRQTPDNAFQTSGWRWHFIEAALQPGTGNTIDVVRGSADLQLNLLMVANADDLAAAAPHRLVQTLPAGDQADLLAYLRQLDGRDAAGAPLAAPPAPPAAPPTIVTSPASQTLAVGNTASFSVAVAGTGPFAYQWYRDSTPVGGDSPAIEIANLQPSDAGSYTVTVTNAQGGVTSAPATLTVNAPLSVTTPSLPAGRVARPYEFALSATGGVDARNWTIAAGVLPRGLALTGDGRLVGTPLAPARGEVTVRASDSSGSATRQLAFEIAPLGGFSPDPSLVLHYTFDEGAGTRVWDAASAGQNHAIDVPGATWAADGRFGGAYGPADLAAALTPFFPANQGDLDFDPQAEAFTISVWVRTTATQAFRALISKDNAPADFRVQYRLWATNPVTSVQGNSGNQSGVIATTVPAVNDGQWHLLTLVNFFDGSLWRSRLYYDQGSAYVEFNTGSGGRVTPLMRIGDTVGGGSTWRGQIDDLRIFRRALTPAEVAALHGQAPLVAYDSWLNSQAAPLPTGQRGPDADPDSDGLPNLLEFALGGDPADPNNAPAPVLTATGPEFRYTYLRARAGIVYTVESTTDLVSGAWSAVGVAQDQTTPVGQNATATMARDASPARFFRLRITEP
jgi:YVTN family beta-propeller protein